MNNRDTLEGMLDTIARLGTRDEASIRAAFTDPKPAEVKIGARGVGLKLGKATAIWTQTNGHIETGAANFGAIAPVTTEFVLGEVVAPVDPVSVVPLGEPVAVAPVVEAEGELPRRRRESGRTAPVEVAD